MTTLPAALALITVREGILPAGAEEAAAEAGGAALLAGTGTRQAGTALSTALRVFTAESSTAPGTLAATLAPLLTPVHTLVLPGSPDGRDLAPRLAAELGRPLLAGAVEVLPHGADVLRHDGRTLVELTAHGPFLVTLIPGLRGTQPAPGRAQVTELAPTARPVPDARTLTTLTAPATGGPLADARRILGAGGGLGSPQAVHLLTRVAAALDASVGATRVVTDAGWLGHQHQIGTTGVSVDPDLYVAFGVSGAPQHVGGLGSPRQVVSVNTDPYCPMSAQADLGIVADATAVLTALAQRLALTGTPGTPPTPVQPAALGAPAEIGETR